MLTDAELPAHFMVKTPARQHLQDKGEKILLLLCRGEILGACPIARRQRHDPLSFFPNRLSSFSAC